MVTELLLALVGDTLLLSAGSKCRHWSKYIDALESYASAQWVPGSLLLVVAYVAPCAEIGAFALAALPAFALYGAVLATILYLSYFLLLRTDERPALSNCGCWGSIRVPVARRAFLLRNLLLLLVALLCLTLLSFERLSVGAAFVAESIGMMAPLAWLALESPQLIQVAAIRRASVTPSLPRA